MPSMPWLPWRRRVALSSVDEHPNLPEIVGILGKVPHLTDRELVRLARGWRDNIFLATARDHALSPDSPLIIDVLAAFDRIDAAFFDDLADGEEQADGVAPDLPGIFDTTEATRPHHVMIALKAIRDAVAAAYAKPILGRAEYIALIGPWRCTFPADDTFGRIVTRTTAVDEILQALSPLAVRCHDAASKALFAKLAEAARVRDSAATEAARETAWRSAISSSRRRQWTLLRQTVHDTLSRPCPTCQVRVSEPADVTDLVRALCADAVCGMLVADSVEPTVLHTLVDPAARLLPTPRTPTTD